MLRFEGRLPGRLRAPPLVETVFELRFDPTPKTVAELSPGLLYSALEGEYPDSELQPLGSLPRNLRDKDPDLWYAPSHRLTGPEGVILIGDRVLGVAKTFPYRGWVDFRQRIDRFLAAVRSLALIDRISRCSMKSVNVLPGETGKQLKSIQASVILAREQAPETGFRLRTEYQDESQTLIVQIRPNAVFTPKGGQSHTGLLIDLDAIMNFSPHRHLWEDPMSLVESLHERTKSAFFSLLTAETLQTLGPEG